MAEEKVYRVLESSIKAIADAIREKNAEARLYDLSEMPAEIKKGSISAYIKDNDKTIYLSGEYNGVPLYLSENGYINLRNYIQENNFPLDITVETMVPTGTLDIDVNGNYNVKEYEFVNVNIDTRLPEQQKEVSYDTNGEYTVEPDEGQVLNKVDIKVNVPIPEGYIVPSGTKPITENGEHNVNDYKFVDVNVPIPEGYIVPEGNIDITNTAEVDVTNYATAKIADDNLTAENIAENVTVLGITGTFRGGVDTSDATATSDDLLLGKTAYAKEQKLVGTIEDYDYSTDAGVKIEYTDAFYRLVGGTLTEVDDDRVTALKNYAFYMDKTVECIRFNNLGALQTGVFGGCSALIELHLPNCKQIYGGSCIANCTSLKVLDMPVLQSASASSIMSGCSALEEVNFSQLTTVGGSFFGNCYSLVKTDFGTLKVINATSFNNCYSLKKIIIRGDTVCELRNSNAFGGCYHLLGTVDETYNPEGLKDGYIYVPDNLVDSYKSATNWVTYASQIKSLNELEVE